MPLFNSKVAGMTNLRHIKFHFDFVDDLNLIHFNNKNGNPPYISEKVIFPPNVTHITFDAYSVHLSGVYQMIWPETLTHLHLGVIGASNEDLEIAWPDSLTHLSVSFMRNCLRMRWPRNLSHLVFGDRFDLPLSNDMKWPATLTHITFGKKFNQDIPEGWLPSTLTHLRFAKESLFNKAMVALPRSLTHLTLGRQFNQPLHELKRLPQLTHLMLGQFFNQPLIEGVLPDTLTHLKFEWGFNHYSPDGKFDEIKITDNITLPPNLKSLSVGDRTINIERRRGILVAIPPFPLGP